MLGSWVRAPAGSPEKGRSRPSFFRFREGEIFVFGKERPVLSGRFPRIGRVRSTLSGKQVDVFPLPAAGTFEFRRLAATLADRRAADAVFGGGFPKRVEHLTGGDAPYLLASSSQHRPNGAFPAAGRAGFRDEAIRLRRPYMAAGPALECHAGLAVDILGQRDDLRMQQVQSFDEPFMREFQPAGTAGASRTPAQGRGRNGPLVIADLAPHPDFIRGPRVFADNLDFRLISQNGC